jgi:hypothetical protein
MSARNPAPHVHYVEPITTRVHHVHHDAKGSRRFRCVCKQLLTWPSNPKPGVRIKELHRDIKCGCGIVHTR